ncbi:MAG: CapA family protein [Salinivirgaceae bacterium]|nr:CapA family protein [Salinivirgaceae bacterium]
MKLKTIILPLLAIAVQPLAAQNADSVVTLLFAGDIMGHDAQIAAAYNDSTKTYDYTDCFSYIKPYIEKADFALANFEVTLAGPPFKGYPQFSSPDALAVAVKDCGFDALVTSNNHTCDGGRVGVVRTLDVLDSLQIPHTGTFHDSAEFRQKYPLIVDVKGIKLAILNYTYGTNELPTPKGTVVNRIDKNNIINDIASAKKLNPDLIVACMHWGIEYDSMPSRSQLQMTDLLKKQGVDLIIGSHPHVLQPMEMDSVANQLIIYSLGNFVSAQRTAPRDGAAVVNVRLTKRNGQKPKIEANYQLTYVHYPKVGGKRLFYVIPLADAEAGLIPPIQSDNWGRMSQFATEAREVLGRNKNVPEAK